MRLTINGEDRNIESAGNIAELLGELGIASTKVAVERNLEIVPKTAYGETPLIDGDKFEIVHFIGGGSQEADLAAADDAGFVVAGKKFSSRLLVGTGKYKDFDETRVAIEQSGAEIVTVAVRRVNLTDPNQPMLVDYVDPKKYTYLPNTAGCFTADDAVRTLRLARESEHARNTQGGRSADQGWLRCHGILQRRSYSGQDARRHGMLCDYAAWLFDRVGYGHS